MSDLALGVPSPVSKKHALAAESPAPVSRKIALSEDSLAPISKKHALAAESHPMVWKSSDLVVASLYFDFRTLYPPKRPLFAVQTTLTQAFRTLAFT